MSKKPVNLATKRAERERDNTKWSARDALQHVIDLIDSGKIDPDLMCICFHVPDDWNETRWHSFWVNATSLEKLGIAAVLSDMVLRDSD